MRWSLWSAFHVQVTEVVCSPAFGQQASQGEGSHYSPLSVSRNRVLRKTPVTAQGGSPGRSDIIQYLVVFMDASLTGWGDVSLPFRRGQVADPAGLAELCTVRLDSFSAIVNNWQDTH